MELEQAMETITGSERNHEDKEAILMSKDATLESMRTAILMAIQEYTTPKRAQAIRMIIGLPPTDRTTLEKIGAEMGVTRERARQIINQGLLQLKSSAGNIFEEYIISEQQGIYKALARTDGRIYSEGLKGAIDKLDPYFRLSLRVQFMSPSEWLDKYASEITGGWLLKKEEADKFEKWREKIATLAPQFAIPTPLTTLKAVSDESLDIPDDADLTVAGYQVINGYVCHMGCKVDARATRLHRLAKEIAPEGLVDLGVLTAAYTNRHHDDKIAANSIRIAIENTPSLFSTMFRNTLIVLDHNMSTAENATLPKPSESRQSNSFSRETETALKAIINLLEKKGPMVTSEIVSSITKENSTALGTGIPSTLQRELDFVLVAPGVNALAGQSLWENGKPVAALLNERLVRNYCLVRHGGAPYGYYPAWTPAYEMALVKWAWENTRDLVQSLLSVSEPEKWPARKQVIDAYMSEKMQKGKWFQVVAWTHKKTRKNVTSVLPNRMLAVVAHLARFGWTSMSAINRSLGERVECRNGIDVLGLLVSTGLAKPTDDMFERHQATKLASDAFKNLAYEMHTSGKLSWDKGALLSLHERIGCAVGNMGWVKEKEIQVAIALRQSSREEKSTTKNDVDEPAESTPSL